MHIVHMGCLQTHTTVLAGSATEKAFPILMGYHWLCYLQHKTSGSKLTTTGTCFDNSVHKVSRISWLKNVTCRQTVEAGVEQGSTSSIGAPVLLSPGCCSSSFAPPRRSTRLWCRTSPGSRLPSGNTAWWCSETWAQTQPKHCQNLSCAVGSDRVGLSICQCRLSAWPGVMCPSELVSAHRSLHLWDRPGSCG